VPSVPHSAAADRNKQPILDVLRTLLPASGTALEIAAGTGQHAAWFAAALPGWTWQPTDADPRILPTIAAWTSQDGLPNVRPPVLLDVMDATWPSQGPDFAERFDAIYCCNMLHIAPWPACGALMRGAARYLVPDGVLVTYGPYLEDAVATSRSNLDFDADLRERNPQWGLRRLEDVAREAREAGLGLRARHAMPAKTCCLSLGSRAERRTRARPRHLCPHFAQSRHAEAPADTNRADHAQIDEQELPLKSRTLLCTLAAASLTFSSLSFGQGYDRGRDRGDGDRQGQYQRGDRDGRGDDRRGYQRGENDRRGDHRGDRGHDRRADQYHYGARGPEWRRGGHVPYQYRSHQYVVNDWRGHHLHAPPRGHQWVQVGGDYVLMAIATGIIVNLMLAQ
jgi:Ni/Co efflux regulator RcnB/SAM-dependent methyltransferase